MISDRLRKVLTAAAWILILFGPVLTVLTLLDVATTPGGFVGGGMRGAISLAVGLVSPVVTGGILLALLSIDRRLEAKA